MEEEEETYLLLFLVQRKKVFEVLHQQNFLPMYFNVLKGRSTAEEHETTLPMSMEPFSLFNYMENRKPLDRFKA